MGQNFAVETPFFMQPGQVYNIQIGLVRQEGQNQVIIADGDNRINVQSALTALPLLAERNITHLNNQPFEGESIQLLQFSTINNIDALIFQTTD